MEWKVGRDHSDVPYEGKFSPESPKEFPEDNNFRKNTLQHSGDDKRNIHENCYDFSLSKCRRLFDEVVQKHKSARQQMVDCP